jgi:transcriptional regulator with XRE-family HTH domain
MAGKRSEFGAKVSHHLKKRSMTQETLASAIGRSQSYTNQVINGQKTPSARWADLVADALQLSPVERLKLHAAAAKDNGFRIELPEFDER